MCQVPPFPVERAVGAASAAGAEFVIFWGMAVESGHSQYIGVAGWNRLRSSALDHRPLVEEDLNEAVESPRSANFPEVRLGHSLEIGACPAQLRAMKDGLATNSSSRTAAHNPPLARTSKTGAVTTAALPVDEGTIWRAFSTPPPDAGIDPGPTPRPTLQ